VKTPGSNISGKENGKEEGPRQEQHDAFEMQGRPMQLSTENCSGKYQQSPTENQKLLIRR
jgi:hypothetical protein